MDVTFITSTELIEAKFHLAAPLLQPVIDQAARGEFTVDDIRELVAQGKVIVALVEQEDEAMLAMAFEFVHYPQTLAINIMALGGSKVEEAAQEFWERFKDWCRSAGATVMEASCSDAMARLLGRYGFNSTYRVVRAAL